MLTVVVEWRNFQLFLGKTSKNFPLAYIYNVAENPKHILTPRVRVRYNLCIIYGGDHKEKVGKKYIQECGWA